jgi:transcriptional regulator with XRE-family HTH domain
MNERISNVFNEAIRRNPKIEQRLREALPRARIAASLVRLRNSLGYTQRDVATLMNTPQSNVARLEKATGNPQTTDALVAYAQACGLTLGVVFMRQEGDLFNIVEASAIGGGERADGFLRSMITVEPAKDNIGQPAEAEVAAAAASYP